MSTYQSNYTQIAQLRSKIIAFLNSPAPHHWQRLAVELLPDIDPAMGSDGRARSAITFAAISVRGILDKQLGRAHPELAAAIGAITARVAALTKAPQPMPLPQPPHPVAADATTAPQARRRQATGGRRAHTLETIALSRSDFLGLPEGVKHPKELLALVKKAAPYLGVAQSVIALVDLLFAHTRPQDWEAGTRPIVWPSNRLIEEHLQIGDRAVKALIRQAHEQLLFAMKDNPSGKRHGLRDPSSGKLVLAHCYGFDLSPLATRYVELKRVADQGRSNYEARTSAARMARIARHRILQCLATAEEQGLWSLQWEEVERRATPLTEVIDRSRSLTELDQVAATLKQIASDAEAHLAAALAAAPVATTVIKTQQDSPSGESDVTLNNSTINPSDKKSVQAPAPTDPPAPTPNTDRHAGVEKGDAGFAKTNDARVWIKPAELASLSPALGDQAPSDPTWDELAKAAADHCVAIGIAQRIWHRAVDALGAHGAVIALALTLAKPQGHFTSNAGAYFASLVARAERGEFHLGPAIYGLRRRRHEATSPIVRPSRGEASTSRTNTPATGFDATDAERQRQTWLRSLAPDQLRNIEQRRAAYIAGLIKTNGRGE